MKRLVITLAILTGALAAFAAGRADGIRHALNDAEYFLTDITFVSENVYVFDESDEYDYTIGIILDGELYENYGYIG